MEEKEKPAKASSVWISISGDKIFLLLKSCLQNSFPLVQTEHNFANGWVRVLIIFVKNGWADSPGDRCFLIC